MSKYQVNPRLSQGTGQLSNVTTVEIERHLVATTTSMVSPEAFSCATRSGSMKNTEEPAERGAGKNQAGATRVTGPENHSPSGMISPRWSAALFPRIVRQRCAEQLQHDEIRVPEHTIESANCPTCLSRTRCAFRLSRVRNGRGQLTSERPSFPALFVRSSGSRR